MHSRSSPMGIWNGELRGGRRSSPFYKPISFLFRIIPPCLVILIINTPSVSVWNYLYIIYQLSNNYHYKGFNIWHISTIYKYIKNISYNCEVLSISTEAQFTVIPILLHVTDVCPTMVIQYSILSKLFIFRLNLCDNESDYFCDKPRRHKMLFYFHYKVE